MPPTAPANPDKPLDWWGKAQAIAPDPTQLDILTYEAHSASKFDLTDFIYLKALWKNKPVTEFHASDYVRAEYVAKALGLLGQKPSPPSEQGQQPILSLRQNMVTFIKTVDTPFRSNDPGNAQLGAFLVTKWLLEQTKAVNKEGVVIGGDTLKIVRRSDRQKDKREAKEAAERMRLEKEGASLNLQMAALAIHGTKTPPEAAPQTPAQQLIEATSPTPAATHELEVFSPRTMELEKARSEDEEIVNSALINLLVSMTLCSGIGAMKGREGLQWMPRRHSFSLGSANNVVCEARTDGLLRNPGNPDCGGPLAILEVKPYMRTAAQAKIEWQEACQMAAWISTTLGEKKAEKRRAGTLSTADNSKKRCVL